MLETKELFLTSLTTSTDLSQNSGFTFERNAFIFDLSAHMLNTIKLKTLKMSNN